MGVNSNLFYERNLGRGGGLFNFAATCIQVQIYFCPLCYAILVTLQENPHRQIQSHINKQVILKKSLRSCGLILSPMKKCDVGKTETSGSANQTAEMDVD